MMKEEERQRRLYLWKGKLRVAAKGYWYTSGGEKGSFGFYPHLKRREGNKDYPVFPDTQLQGDFRMASRWLTELKEEPEGKDEENGERKKLIVEIFGLGPTEEYRDTASRLCFSDLELAPESKKQWETRRFQIKPRIMVEDGTRTVMRQMLVSHEMSYLDSLTLEADVFLGYFQSEERLREAKELLTESAFLLSGFGAFRSRGYGRGVVEIDFKDEDVETFVLPHRLAGEHGSRFLYALNALVNFRSKEVDPGSAQVLLSRPYVTDGQIRAWFVKAFHELSGKWPTVEQMTCLRFSSLYPSYSDGEGVTPCVPNAMTTLKSEEGNVRDRWGGAGEASEDKTDERGSLFSPKTKPLPPGSYVSDSEDFIVHVASAETRVRNSTEANFATLKEGGLFTHELINKGSCFAGHAFLVGNNDTFLRDAEYILKNVKPMINGCLFEPKLIPDDGRFTQDTGRRAVPLLVVEPVPYDDSLVNFSGAAYSPASDEPSAFLVKKDANQIALTTERRYSVQLRRPRRPRIAISTGSVINKTSKDFSGSHRVIGWKGFGKAASLVQREGSVMDEGTAEERTALYAEQVEKLAGLVNALIESGMTRSQAGILREFRNEKRRPDELGKVADDRVEKYSGKESKKAYLELYRSVAAFLKEFQETKNEQYLNDMRRYLDDILDRLYEKWWGKRKAGA